MSGMLEDIEGVEVVVDDLFIWGENQAQHDEIKAEKGVGTCSPTKPQSEQREKPDQI